MSDEVMCPSCGKWIESEDDMVYDEERGEAVCEECSTK